MLANAPYKQETISPWHLRLLLAAAVMSYLVVTAGGIVCVTGSGYGCPDWPGCYGQALPPMRTEAIIEYSHRLVAALTSPVVLAAALAGWWKTRAIPWLSWLPLAAVGLMLVVSAFGALVVLAGLPRGWAAVDLGSALLMLALMVAAAASVCYTTPGLPGRLSLRRPFARLAAATTVAAFALLVSGVLVADTGSIERCLGWPLLAGGYSSLLLGRRLLAAAVTIMIVALVWQAWRTQRNQRPVFGAAIGVGLFFLAHMAAGALLANQGFSLLLLVIYAATVTAVWALLVAVLVLAGLALPLASE
jgi:cytochrome c oxidase assembly protein subunit 15